VIPVEKKHYEASTIVRKAKGDDAALSEEDLSRFLARLKAHKSPHYFPLAAAQFGLSLRIGEVCALDKRFIDLDEKTIRIGQTVIWNDRTWEASLKLYPKNGHVRHLSIPDFLVSVFRDWIANSDPKHSLLFHKNGEFLNRKTIGTAYNCALRELDIDYVSGQLGHSSVEVTKRYLKRISSQKVKVANTLNEVANRVLVPSGPQGKWSSENSF